MLMKRLFCIGSVALCFSSAIHSQTTDIYAGGDGSSIRQAIVIIGAEDNIAGVRAEYSWLLKQFPGYRRRG